MPENKQDSAPQLDVPAARSPLRFGDVGQQLIKNMPLGVIAFDSHLNITDSNPLACQTLAPGSNVAQVLAAGTGDDGQDRWSDKLLSALNTAQACTFEAVPYSWNDQSVTLSLMCTPLTHENTNQLLGGILLIHDVTALKAMEEDLAAAERLAAVGKLAARIAHELNNPLDGILRYINLALRVAENATSDQIPHYLRESRKGLMRMVQIISELLEFSRSTYSAFQEADINKITEDALKVFESQAQENHVEIVRQYASEMPNIRSGNLFQVFCNLIKNALDAMPAGGELKVTTFCSSDQARIEFADTGTGMTDEVRKKLFEPFFSTKESGKGTGLGLAISKDIVERYGGKIEAQNRPAGGGLFTVGIPLQRTSWGRR
ncbi:MAG: hypothetical protein AMJ79_10855, partial [Phycisphaerae bacterium SM23_30]